MATHQVPDERDDADSGNSDMYVTFIAGDHEHEQSVPEWFYNRQR